MKFSLTVLPEAEQDISEAYRWYEERSPGLGSEFLRAMDVCLASIERNPVLHQTIDELMRRALVRRFPYAIYYFTEGDRIAVLACFHVRRDSKRVSERAR
jgi:plasmid stabilization system protein ParE